MTARIGDRIIVESEKVGTPPRVGEILAVSSGVGVEYSVRWADGHESSYRPAAGSSRIERTSRSRPAR